MSNKPGIVRSMLAQGTLAALLGSTLGCGASSLVVPTPTRETPSAVAPAPVAPRPAAPSGVYTITAGANTVAPGGQLSVSWTTSIPYPWDSISLVKKGDPNAACIWSQSTGGVTSGTLTLIAPTQEGQYEFRYLLEDLTDVARSSMVTVGVGS
jgi:hypothetical protein